MEDHKGHTDKQNNQPVYQFLTSVEKQQLEIK